MSLGVLESTRPVVDQARHVRLDRQQLGRLCDGWAADPFPVPPWDSEVHFNDSGPRTANLVLLLDALNFCFWADRGQPRWELEYQGRWYNGYRALAAGLKKAVEGGLALDRADLLADLSAETLAAVFAGRGQMPMLAERLANAREVGRVLSEQFGGQFVQAIESCGGSARQLVRLLAERFRSFHDYSVYQGQEVRLLKRAQITAVDLFGTFGGEGPGRFTDLAELTAFADYKIPQVLRAQGIMVYSEELAAIVDARELIPAGDPREVEIRAVMVWAVEEIRRALQGRGRDVAAYEIDWFLWNVGQAPVADERPYHRTRTIYY